MLGIAWVTLVVLPGASLAQSQETASPESPTNEAKRLFLDAIEELDSGNAAIGRDLLRRSLMLDWRVTTRYNLGVALRLSGDTTEAIATLVGLLEERKLPPDLRDKAVEQLAMARSELATIEVTVTGVDRATIELDGREVGEATGGTATAFHVDAGEHVVLARAEGTSRSKIRVGRGETVPVRLHVIPPPEQERREKRRRRQRAAWISTASAIVAGVVVAAVVVTRPGPKDLVPGDTATFNTQ